MRCTWRDRKWRLAGDADLPEPRHRAGRDRQDEPRRLRLMVDDDVLLADLGGGEAPLAKRHLERDAGLDHLLRDDRIAGLDRERLAQSRSLVPSRLVEPRQLDAFEAVERPGDRRQLDEQFLAGGIDARLDRRVIIALAAQQLGQQLGVGAGAAVDLRGVGGLARGRLPAPTARRSRRR